MHEFSWKDMLRSLSEPFSEQRVIIDAAYVSIEAFEILTSKTSKDPSARKALFMTEKSVAEVVPEPHPEFDRFVATIEALRAPDGCPWDREQTHHSIAHNMIEEAYEAVDAIDAHSTRHLREELGDVLLQVVLQSQIAADAGEFTIDDVCRDINEKMIRRHPHVFGEAKADNANEVTGLWEQVKLAEKEAADAASKAAGAPGPEGLLDSVPTSFPSLMQAQKISRKAAAAGFEWDTVDDVWAKVAEEAAELKAAYAAAPKSADGKVLKDVAGDAVMAGAPSTPSAGDAAAADVPGVSDTGAHAGGSSYESVELEMGDLLFSLVNVARRMGVDAENALRSTCAKFRRRWAFMEGAALGQGRRVEELDAEELESLWSMAKLLEGASEQGGERP